MPVSQRKHASFSYSFKSFIGFLEGTDKAKHTIDNYAIDLRSFQTYLVSLGYSPKATIDQVKKQEIEHFGDYLKLQGLRSNTCRRKILTLRKYLRYLQNRKKISLTIGHQLPAPNKVERLPKTISIPELVARIQMLPHDSLLDQRTRCLLWLMTETGILPSEVGQIKKRDFDPAKNLISVPYGRAWGKSQAKDRTFKLSKELSRAIANMISNQKNAKPETVLFSGFNRYGMHSVALGGITSRGVELLFKFRHDLFEGIKPRELRHSLMAYWLKSGVSQEEIKRRFGFKSDYPFRAFKSF